MLAFFEATTTFEKIENVFFMIVKYCSLIVEFIGVCLLMWAIFWAVIGLFRKKDLVRLHLAEGIALALEFKLGSELLKTLTVSEWSELLILGAIILLRAALTFLIQWEIRIEKKNGQLVDVSEIKPDRKEVPKSAPSEKK
ncbi:MAG: DUF1622 domain-containing protein [Corallococcus sp.]|nr:DUF1622 domain-containing protein [Corallococcus sp.]